MTRRRRRLHHVVELQLKLSRDRRAPAGYITTSCSFPDPNSDNMLHLRPPGRSVCLRQPTHSFHMDGDVSRYTPAQNFSESKNQSEKNVIPALLMLFSAWKEAEQGSWFCCGPDRVQVLSRLYFMNSHNLKRKQK